MSSKDHLETIQKSAHQLLRECHITDIIRQKKEKLQELDDACQLSKSVTDEQSVENLFEWLSISSGFVSFKHTLFYSEFVTESLRKKSHKFYELIISF